MSGPEFRCDACGDSGRVRWMSEGDPNMYMEPDANGTVPCLDCGARGEGW